MSRRLVFSPTAFDVDAGQVSIIGVFYGGQQYEAMLREDAGNASAY